MNLNLPPIPKIYHNAFIATPILTKIVLLIVMFCSTRNFYDAYDYQLYYSAAHNIFSGLLPWANGVPILYPPLAFIPMIISYIVSLTTAPIWFFVSMWVLLSICDIITVFCIYYVGLKLYSKQTAFVAALLYATAISVMFFFLTKFDSFPTCIMMLAILFTIYGEKEKGYLFSIVGLFTKIWPIIIYPFLWIYNSKKRSLLEEGKKRAVLYLLGAGILFAFMILLGYSVLSTFTNFVYCNTIVFTLDQYFKMVGVGVPFDIFVTVFRILLVCILIGLMAYQYKNKKNVVTLLKVILVAIMAIVFMIQYRSPQYNVWFIPLAALLLANRGWGIITFIGVQILCFIEFPVIWGSIYVNDNYTSPLALWFFTLYFFVMGAMLVVCLRFDNTGINK
jgi:hypothetical protein